MSSRIFVCALILLFSGQVLAETVYIRDALYVPLRSGQSTQHKILHQGIKSGTPLERLDENEETGYTKVRMQNGLEGWIQTQYLQAEPVAADLLKTARSRAADLQAQLRQAQQRVQTLEDENSELSEANDALREQMRALSDDLNEVTELASDEIAISQENQGLKEKNQLLQNELDSLTLSNARLQDESDQQWFLIGAGVVFAALLLGYLLARRVYTRRGGWRT
ncbi:MAG: TIGR04211 family SH3 domain-containing protein [Pseudomonadales bacterium]|nr:TIGR04211 family SH3 domain-containing protein [Pseudomonadales bacterium]